MNHKLTALSLRKRLEFQLASKFGWILILLLGKSLKLKCEGIEYIRSLEDQGQAYLIALWHGRFLLPLFRFRRHGFVVLVSQHLDGEMIAQNLHRLGYSTVRGSSTRRGKESFYEMTRAMSDGRIGVIIPDGPTGPRHKLKAGVTFMAMKADVPILPMTFSATPGIVLKSWDRFLVPKPFATAIIKIGPPIWIPAESKARDLVRLSRKVEQDMIEQELAADAALNIQPLQ